MAGIDVSLPVINWCINPIILRVEWWFDGKHFSSLSHVKSNCTSYGSCLQRVSRAKRLVSDSCCARRCLTQLAGDRDKLFSVQSVSQSVNASFTWDLTIQSVFGLSSWLSTRSSTFSVFSLTHTERGLPLPGCRSIVPSLQIFFNKVSILPHFEHLLWACLTDTWIERTYV